MQEKSTHGKKGKKAKIIIALSLVAVLAVGCVVTFFAIGGRGGLPAMGSGRAPAVVEGDVKALTILPSGNDVSEEALREYYAETVAFSVENGINTIIFKGKTGISVYWRDAVFPVAAEIGAQDTFFHEIDPLMLLCEEADGSGLQIWVEADLYNADGYNTDQRGKVAKLAGERGGVEIRYFSMSDEEYRGLLVQSLTRLQNKYPIAGVMVSGLEKALQIEGITGDAWNAGFGALAQDVHDAWEKESSKAVLAVSFDGGEQGAFAGEAAKLLEESGAVDYLLPMVETAGGNLSARLAAWRLNGVKTVAVVPNEGAELFLFTAGHLAEPSLNGVLFGGYERLRENPAHMGYLEATMVSVEGELPTGYDIPRDFMLTFPELGSNGIRFTTYEDVYLMGTSDPAFPLLLDGVEIGGQKPDGTIYGARGAGGAFGVLVPLIIGDNVFTFTQGESVYTETIRRTVPTGSGGGALEDGTVPAPPGQAMRIKSSASNGYIASALADYSNAATMNETLYNGAVFVVRESKPYRSGNVYRLASGDWVHAYNCEWIAGDGLSHFTGLIAEAHEKGEYIRFAGSGTPAAYIAYDNQNNRLTVRMYDTSFSLPEGFSSQYVRSAFVTPTADGVVLTLELNEIWGYNIEYVGDQTSLFLKKVPQRSADPIRPLQGVSVLLDPGHGGNPAAPGSGGIMWYTGPPHEKDINLTLAKAIAYRLRQMGAEVILTREEDVDVTLGDRHLMQRELKPDFFLSIHHDAVDLNRDISGMTSMRSFFYHPYTVPGSREYAQNLMDAVSTNTGRENINAEWGYYLVTRVTICPSVLFEYGFLVNPIAFEDVVSTDGIWAAAVGTGSGILASVPVNDPAPQEEPSAEDESSPSAPSFTALPARRRRL